MRRKDLKVKPEAPPVDPSTLFPEALARREGYQREEAERREAGIRRDAKAKEESALRDAAAGKRAINAADALRRHR